MQLWHKLALIWLPIAVLGIAAICYFIRSHRPR